MIGAVTAKVHTKREVVLEPSSSKRRVNSSLKQIEQKVKTPKWWQCYWGYYVVITFVIMIMGLGTVFGFFLSQYVTDHQIRSVNQSSARHLGCEDWRLINNSRCEKHLMTNTNCQNDTWDCLENGHKETIATVICELMIECCDFIRFAGTCQNVDVSYSWNYTLQEMTDGLEGWKECKKNKNIKWNLCSQI